MMSTKHWMERVLLKSLQALLACWIVKTSFYSRFLVKSPISSVNQTSKACRFYFPKEGLHWEKETYKVESSVSVPLLAYRLAHFLIMVWSEYRNNLLECGFNAKQNNIYYPISYRSKHVVACFEISSSSLFFLTMSRRFNLKFVSDKIQLTRLIEIKRLNYLRKFLSRQGKD